MKKTLLALGGAVLLLVAILLVRERDSLKASQARYVFDTAQAPLIERLQVRLQDDSVTLAKRDGRWLVMPEGFPADSARVALALGHLLRLEDKEVVSAAADAGRLADFGLHAEEVKHVSWTSRGVTTRIHLGHTSGIDFNSTYWKHPERTEVYRTPGNFTHEIGAHAREWKDKTLFPAFGPEDVRALDVRWRDEAGRLVAYQLVVGADSAFRMTVPGRADTTLIPAGGGRQLFDYASRLAVDEIPDADDPYVGFAVADTPAVALTISLQDGATYGLKVGVEAGDYGYFAHPAHGGVVALFASRLAHFKKTPAQLRIFGPEAGPVPGETWEDVVMPGGAD